MKQREQVELLDKATNKAIKQVEKERNYDRSWATKQHLVNLKKEKLAAKDQIQNGKKI